MKVEQVILKDVEYKDTGDGFERVFTNEKRYPVYLTNYALKKGKEYGIIDTSVFSELAMMEDFVKKVDENGDLKVGSLRDFEEERIMKVIYVGFIGANPKADVSYDDFMSRYHGGIEDMLELYVKLLSSLVASDPNQFSKELEKATEKSKKKSLFRR